MLTHSRAVTVRDEGGRRGDLVEPVTDDAPARLRVLTATCTSLIGHGAGGTTTAVIASEAGLAQGTIFRYFPTKADLFCATAAWILADVRARAAADLASLGVDLSSLEPVEAIDLAMGVVWRQYERPDLVAVHDLFQAARTDPALDALLEEMDGPHRQELHAMARAVLPPELAARSDFDAVVDFVLDGIASIATNVAGTAHERQLAQLALLRASVHALLEGEPVSADFALPLVARPAAAA